MNLGCPANELPRSACHSSSTAIPTANRNVGVMGIHRHSILCRCWGGSWGLHTSVLTHQALSSLSTGMSFVGSHILARTRCPPPSLITWLGKVGAEAGGETSVPPWGPHSRFKSEAVVFVLSRLAYPLGSHGGPGTDTASLTALLPREPPLHSD